MNMELGIYHVVKGVESFVLHGFPRSENYVSSSHILKFIFFSNFPNNLILRNDHNQSYRVEKDIKTLQLITFSFDIIYGLKIYYFKVLTLLKFKIFK